MKKRKLWIIGGVLLVGCFGLSWAILFRPFESGPRYKGLPVSYWRRAVIEAPKRHDNLRGRIETCLGLLDKYENPAIFGGDPAAVPVLMLLLTDKDKDTYWATWNPMSHTLDLWDGADSDRFVPADFVRAIIAEVQNDSPDVRYMAAGVLASYWNRAPAEAIAALIERLQDGDVNVRVRAIGVLGSIGRQATQAVPSLVQLLDDKSAGPWFLSVPEHAAAALRQIDPEAARRAGIK
jgi:hypothetical protein